MRGPLHRRDPAAAEGSASRSPPRRGPWPSTIVALEAAQREVAALAARVPPWEPPSGRLRIAGVFCANRTGLPGPGRAGEPAWAAAVVMEGRRVLGRAVVRGETGAPYVPGVLALREGPLLERALRELNVLPDVVVVNATGRDHPRGAGLAVHLGWILSLPTVGVTDRPLVAGETEPGPGRGDNVPLLLGGQVVGCRLRTKPGVHAVVVHEGWRTTPETARDVVVRAVARARTPEPLRRARQLARSRRAFDEGRLHPPPRSGLILGSW